MLKTIYIITMILFVLIIMITIIPVAVIEITEKISNPPELHKEEITYFLKTQGIISGSFTDEILCSERLGINACNIIVKYNDVNLKMSNVKKMGNDQKHHCIEIILKMKFASKILKKIQLEKYDIYFFQDQLVSPGILMVYGRELLFIDFDLPIGRYWDRKLLSYKTKGDN